MQNTETLVARVRLGDARAFESLYDRHANLVFGVALRMLDDPNAAEDVARTVFLRCWNAPDAFRGENHAARIVRMTRNACLAALRDRADAGERAIPPDTAVEHALDDAALSPVDDARARAAFEALPDDQRAAVRTGFFCGGTYEHAAYLLDATPESVKTRMRAGLRALRRALRDEEHV